MRTDREGNNADSHSRDCVWRGGGQAGGGGATAGRVAAVRGGRGAVTNNDSRLLRMWMAIVEWLVWHMPRKMVESAFWRVWATAVPNEDERDWEKFSIADVAQLWWFGEIVPGQEDVNAREARRVEVYVLSTDILGVLAVGGTDNECKKIASEYFGQPLRWQERDYPEQGWEAGINPEGMALITPFVANIAPEAAR